LTRKISESISESQNILNSETGNDLLTSLKSKGLQFTSFSPKIQESVYSRFKPKTSIYSENLEESPQTFEPLESASKFGLRESIKGKIIEKE